MKTPQQSYPKLATNLGLLEVYLKREDLHHFGSHKGRSIPLMMKKYLDDDHHDFVISSSGNAALAAILFTANHNKNNPITPIKLQVFVGKNIDHEKLANIQFLILNIKKFVTLTQSDKPKQSAILHTKSTNSVNLRQSTDDTALLGYHELAEELNKIDNLQAIFIPTSSGTTAQGLGEAFQKLSQHPQIHIVQTETCNPIVSALKRDPSTSSAELADYARDDSASIASAIVDKIAHRKNKVIEIINQSNSSGWIINNEEITTAIKLVKETCQLDISPNSALSVAGLQKAVANGWKWDGAVVCLITGK